MRTIRRQDYTVAWICALPVELAAARQVLDEEHNDPAPHIEAHDNSSFTLGQIGQHNIVIANLPLGIMGTNSAAAVAAKIQTKFPRVRYGLMVGIGGGVPSEEADVRLGDVVVSSPQKGHGGVVQYDFGKTKPGRFERTGYLNAPPVILLDSIAKMQASQMLSNTACLPSFASNALFTRQSAGPDQLFQPGYHHVGGPECAKCDQGKLMHRQKRNETEARIHYGTIASGNQVMRDGTTRDTVSSELGGVLCFEMEAAGLMNILPCLVIRGICDYADSHKNKKWQPYAAATAAEYAKQILHITPAEIEIPYLADVHATNIQAAEKLLLQDSSKIVMDSLVFPHMHSRQHMIGLPYPGTAEWLLQTAEYDEWIRGQSRFLWLKGKAGSGKSTLMKRTLEEIRRTHSSDSHTIAAFFYDASGSPLEQSTGGLLRSILHQIFTQNKSLLEQFVLEQDGGGFIKGTKLQWRDEELMTVFTVVSRLPAWKPTIILIDALDEGAKNEIHTLIAFLDQQSFKDAEPPFTRLRICMSSRHYPNITLRDCPEIWAEEYNHEDIKTFASKKLENLSDSPGNQGLINSVLEQAAGVFLWVDLITNGMVIDDQDGESLDQRKRTLYHTPPELEGVYSNLFSKLGDSERNDSFQLFKWVLCSSRRLSPMELCFALKFDESKTISTYESWQQSPCFISPGVQMERYIRSRSRGLLEIRHVKETSSGQLQPAVHFIHHTVQEFLARKGFRILKPYEDIYSLMGTCHYDMAATCMRYLSHPGVLSSGSVTQLRDAARRNQQPFLQWMEPQVMPAGDRPPQSPQESELDMSKLMQHVFSDLPLLGYSVESLRGHLSKVESSRWLQGKLYDLLLGLGRAFPFWYGFQDAMILPRTHRFHRVNWHNSLQAVVALGLGSHVRELRRRVQIGRVPRAKPERVVEAFHLAIEQGSEAIVRDLVACGADPNLRGPHEKSSPLEEACIRKDTRMVRTLISLGADVNAQNDLGFASLHRAAQVGDPDTAAVLLDAGADLEARINLSLQTPFLIAVERDHVDTVLLLLRRGADRHAKDSMSRDVSQLAQLHTSTKVYAALHPENPCMPLPNGPRVDRLRVTATEVISRALTASPAPEKQMLHMKRGVGRFTNVEFASFQPG